MRAPRVAYFPDSFHEVNGVAHTSRNFVAYAARKELPFLCVAAGGDAKRRASRRWESCGSWSWRAAAPAIRLEKDLQFDAIFWRHYDRIEWELKRFPAGGDPYHRTERTGHLWGVVRLEDGRFAGGFLAYQRA